MKLNKLINLENLKRSWMICAILKLRNIYLKKNLKYKKQ